MSDVSDVSNAALAGRASGGVYGRASAGIAGRAARHRQKGASAAEVALALPIMMFLLLGLVDLGRGVAAKAALGNAARAATRYASVRSGTSDDPATAGKIETYVRDSVSGIDSELVEVSASWSPSNTRGSKVVVGLSYDFVPIVPFIPVESIELTSTSESIISN